MATWAQLKNALIYNAANPTGCWRDYNDDHDAWIDLGRLARVGEILRLSEVPPEPSVEDYSDLSSDCQPS